MPDHDHYVHLLTSPHFDAARIACGATYAPLAVLPGGKVTCRACLNARPPLDQVQGRLCTCSPTVPLCPACRTWNMAHRGHPTTRPALTTEKAFQEALRQLAVAQGWLYYHTTDSRKSPAGFMDVVAVRGPTLLCAELKMPGKVPTLRQREWLQALGQVERVLVRLWTPDSWDEIAEVIR